MFERLVTGLSKVADNVWAFMLFVIAASVAVAAHRFQDHDLMHFAEGITMTGAALFHTSKKENA